MREPQATRHIAVGCLIDGSGGPAQRNVAIAVDATGKVLAIDRPGHGLPSHHRSIDDLGFATVVPPLVDCSLQLSRSPAVADQVRSFYEGDEEERRAMAARHLAYCRAHGVLAVADGDDPHGLAASLRRTTASPDPAALVTVRTAGALVRSWRDWQRMSLDEVDFLRLAYGPPLAPGTPAADTGSAPMSHDLRLSREELFSILAHREGKKAVVVANGPQAVADALEAGCDAVEQGYGMGKDNLQRMAAQGVLWLPSLVQAKNGLDSSRSGGAICCRFSQCYAAPGKGDPAAAAYWQKMLADQSAQVGLAATLGVKMAIGTGAGAPGVLHGEAVVEEMKLMRKAGLSLEAAVRCASAHGAAFFGLDHLGPLKPGARATFLVVRGGPQQVPRKLGYLEAIYVNGAPSSAYSKEPGR